MHHRYLGNSGLKVSEIALGNWLTHGSQVAREAAIECVGAALDVGITTFDTADFYADSAAESILGEALKAERRESLVLCTKAYYPTGSKGPNDVGLSRKHLIESIDGSLRRLGADYVDLYQAHRWDRETPLEETMLAFADIVRAGKALYIGVSEWTADQIRAAAELARELRIPLISNQPQYNALWRVVEAEVIPACEEVGISQMVWSPVAQGVLTGKYRSGVQPPVGSRAADANGGADMIGRHLRRRVLDRVGDLRPIAQELELTMAQLAIAWVLQNRNVASAVVGASRAEQVLDNARASGVVIPTQMMSRIDEALEGVIERDPALTSLESPSERPDWRESGDGEGDLAPGDR